MDTRGCEVSGGIVGESYYGVKSPQEGRLVAEAHIRANHKASFRGAWGSIMVGKGRPSGAKGIFMARQVIMGG